MSGALKVVNERAYKPAAIDEVIELKVRAMLDAVPGAWHEPRDVMEWIAQHSYVQDVELVQPTARQHDGTAATAGAPDCTARNGAQDRGKHTPGPWTVNGTCVCGPTAQTDERGADEFPDGTFMLAESIFNEANARLIAAAPELLEALKAIVNDPYVAKLGSLKLRAVRAIAKAEGR